MCCSPPAVLRASCPPCLRGEDVPRTPDALRPLRDHRRRRRHARMEIEGRPVIQDVQLSPMRQTGSFFRTRAIEENSSSDGSTIVSAPPPTTSSVSSGPMNAAVFSSSPMPDGERVVGQRGEQPAQPVALAEVLVDDTRLVSPSPGASVTILRPRRRALPAERDHVLAQERRAGRRAGDVDALRRSAAGSPWPPRCRRSWC